MKIISTRSKHTEVATRNIRFISNYNLEKIRTAMNLPTALTIVACSWCIMAC